MRKMLAWSALVFLLTASIGYAETIYGGDTKSYFFEKCIYLIVNITPSEWQEWSAYPDCTEESAGNFFCTCADNWTLYLSPKVNSVGTFDLSITDYYTDDLRPPQIYNLNPKDGSYVNDPAPEISAHYYDYESGIDVSSVRIYVDGTDVTSHPTTSITASKVTYIPPFDLVDGSHLVSVSVVDNVSNSYQTDWSFTVDTVAPSMFLIHPENRTYNSTIPIEVQVTDESPMKYIRRIRDFRYYQTLCRDCNYYIDDWTFHKGATSITIEAEDYAGNVVSETVYFLVDLTPPRIHDILPEDEDVITGSTFWVKYTEDNLKSIDLYWRELPESGNPNDGVITGGEPIPTIHKVPLSYCQSGRRQECDIDIVLSDFDDSYIEYFFHVEDVADNAINSDMNTVRIDHMDPKVDIILPIEDSISSSRKLPFEVSISESVELLEYSLDGGRFRRICRNCEDYEKLKRFKDGTHELLVRATDYAGNVGEDSVSFEIDSVPPRISDQYPDNRDYTNGTFSVTYREDDLTKVSLFFKRTDESDLEYKEIVKTNCLSGNKVDCVFYPSDFSSAGYEISSYHGESIEYYFVLSDQVSNTQSRRVYEATVDTQVPELNIHQPSKDVYTSRIVPIDISVNEGDEVRLEYSDNGGSFRRLCSSCEGYDRTRSFSYEDHDIIFRAEDDAGNVAISTVSFTIV